MSDVNNRKRVRWACITVLVIYPLSSGPVLALLWKTGLAKTIPILGTIVYLYVPLELVAAALGLESILYWYYGLFGFK